MGKIDFRTIGLEEALTEGSEYLDGIIGKQGETHIVIPRSMLGLLAKLCIEGGADGDTMRKTTIELLLAMAIEGTREGIRKAQDELRRRGE